MFFFYDKAVYKTALATPGLLNISKTLKKFSKLSGSYPICAQKVSATPTTTTSNPKLSPPTCLNSMLLPSIVSASGNDSSGSWNTWRARSELQDLEQEQCSMILTTYIRQGDGLPPVLWQVHSHLA